MNCYKGGKFINRIKITGILETVSPLHVGSGEETIEILEDNSEKKTTRIITDFDEKPVIPGSAIKGSMRHWLENLLRSASPVSELIGNPEIIKELTGEENNFDDLLAGELKPFDSAFGSKHHESKLEFWDAHCITEADGSFNPNCLHWDPKRLIYRQVSVAINPATGTAAEHLLYDFEVVPAGVRFNLTICGQNITDEELGLLLMGLNGFNSQIFPLTLGAMEARGFGRFKFTFDKIYRLEKEHVNNWLQDILNKDDAGYNSIPEIDGNEREKCISLAKTQIKNILQNKGGA